MRFGFCGVNVSTNVEHYSDVVSIVKHGEELGYDVAWISDRVRDTFINLTACALATSRINLYTGVVNPYTRHPVINARAIATLDELSNGRAGIGVATGNAVEMTKDMGFETKAGYRRVREQVEITRRLFAGETLTYEGKYFSLHDVKLGMKCRPNIPIYVAGHGEKIAKVTGELGDGAILTDLEPALFEHTLRNVRMAAENSGRTFESMQIVCWIPTCITNDKKKFIDSMRGYTALHFLLSPFETLKSIGITEETYEVIKRGYAKGAHVDPKLEAEYTKKAKEYVTDEMVNLCVLVGTAQEVSRRMEGIVKAGFNEFSLWVPSSDMAEKRRILESFADVMSRFR